MNAFLNFDHAIRTWYNPGELIIARAVLASEAPTAENVLNSMRRQTRTYPTRAPAA
jgi:hypothetical protein